MASLGKKNANSYFGSNLIGKGNRTGTKRGLKSP